MMNFRNLASLGLSLVSTTLALALVNPVNGSFSEVVSFDFKGEPDFRLELIYNHQNEGSPILGSGWCSNVEHSLDLSNAKNPQLVFCGSGQRVSLETETSKAGEGGPVLQKQDNRQVVVFPSGRKMFFDSKGVLTGLWDSSGQHSITREKDRINVLSNGVEIARLVLNRDGKLEKITSGTPIQMVWDKGRLKQIQQASKKWNFEYDSNNRVTKWQTPTSNVSLKYNNADTVSAITAKNCTETLDYSKKTDKEIQIKISSTCEAKDQSQAARVVTLTKTGDVLQTLETNLKTKEETVVQQRESDGSMIAAVRSDGTRMLFDRQGRIAEVSKGARTEIWHYEPKETKVNVLEAGKIDQISIQFTPVGQIESLIVNKHKFKSVLRAGLVQELRGEHFQAVDTDNKWKINGLTKNIGLRAAGERISINTAIETMQRWNSMKEM